MPSLMTSDQSRAYLMEIRGQDVGILVTDVRGYTFFASTRVAFPLDRQRFDSVPAARKALGELLNGQRIDLPCDSRRV